MTIANTLTWFGNIAVLVPLSLALALWIARAVSRRLALIWLAAVGGVGLLTALPKIWLAACHLRIWNVHSPSGHTAFSCVAYGGVAVVLSVARPPLQRIGIAIVALLWIAAIAASRVVIHAHTTQEVVVGVVLGALGVTAFATVYHADRRPPLRSLVPAAAVLTAVALYPPAHFTLEPLLHALGHWGAANAPLCPVRIDH